MIHIAVYKFDILLDAQFLRQPLQRKSVGLAILTQQIRVRGAKDDINTSRILPHNRRHGLNRVFDALARREQSEREQHGSPRDTKLILIKIRIHKRNIGNPVRNNGNF